ncbi:MAG: hypothetical protein AB1646_16460 [Thermodesulfobacteriota bacterium]
MNRMSSTVLVFGAAALLLSIWGLSHSSKALSSGFHTHVLLSGWSGASSFTPLAQDGRLVDVADDDSDDGEEDDESDGAKSERDRLDDLWNSVTLG